jgi:hypothetical protein
MDHLEKLKYLASIGNRAPDLPTHSLIPIPTELHRPPKQQLTIVLVSFVVLTIIVINISNKYGVSVRSTKMQGTKTQQAEIITPAVSHDGPSCLASIFSALRRAQSSEPVRR